MREAWNRAAVGVDGRFGNCEARSQPSKLLRDQFVGLGKGVENSLRRFRVESNAGVRNLHYDLPSSGPVRPVRSVNKR